MNTSREPHALARLGMPVDPGSPVSAADRHARAWARIDTRGSLPLSGRGRGVSIPMASISG
ncbi:MAG TPA: hypothetical protein VFK86_11290 [Bauldia sp.]|nr:hypothetical protein [Bauldia sp.]